MRVCCFHLDDTRPRRYRNLGILWIAIFLSGCFSSHTQMPMILASDETAFVYPELSLGLDNITSFDVAMDHAHVHLIVAGSLTNSPKQTKVHYVHSEDGGKHWSIPVAISGHAPPPIASRGNDIQFGSTDQQLLAVWQTQGELPNMGPMVSVYSTDAGQPHLVAGLVLEKRVDHFADRRRTPQRWMRLSFHPQASGGEPGQRNLYHPRIL